MRPRLQPRTLGWIALAAIVFALVALLVPHGHSVDSGDWLAILPLFFVGMISPLTFFAPLTKCYAGRIPAAPQLPASFQRPPPFPRG